MCIRDSLRTVGLWSRLGWRLVSQLFRVDLRIQRAGRQRLQRLGEQQDQSIARRSVARYSASDRDLSERGVRLRQRRRLYARDPADIARRLMDLHRTGRLHVACRAPGVHLARPLRARHADSAPRLRVRAAHGPGHADRDCAALLERELWHVAVSAGVGPALSGSRKARASGLLRSGAIAPARDAMLAQRVTSLTPTVGVAKCSAAITRPERGHNS